MLAERTLFGFCENIVWHKVFDDCTFYYRVEFTFSGKSAFTFASLEFAVLWYTAKLKDWIKRAGTADACSIEIVKLSTATNAEESSPPAED